MAAFKFAGIVCLVYFTILANAGKKGGSVIKKLDALIDLVGKMECPSQGTLNVLCFFFIFVGLSKGNRSVVFSNSKYATDEG